MFKMKTLSFVLILLLVITMAACSANNPSNNTDSGNTTNVSNDAENNNNDKASSNNNKQEAQEDIELEFWTINLKKNFEGYITNMLETYEEQNTGVTINWVDVPGADVTKKLITALASGDVPDVVNLATADMSQIAEYQALLPLNSVADEQAFEPYVDGMLESLKRGDDIMGVPWYTAGPLVQYINTDLYEQAGLDPEKPATNFAELHAYGKQIHEQLPNVYGDNTVPSIEIMISEGLPILNEDRTEAVFNSPEHVKFVESFVEAYKNGALAPGAVVRDDRQLQQTMENGQTAHVGQSVSTVIVSWSKNNPDLIPKVKVAPAVTGKGDVLAIKGYQTFVVPKKTKHPEKAVDLALFVTNHDNQLAFCKEVAIFPSTEETLEDPFFTDVKADDPNDPVSVLSAQAREMQVASADKLTIGRFFFDKEQEARDFYDENIRAALLGEKPVQQALDEAVEFWNRYVK